MSDLSATIMQTLVASFEQQMDSVYTSIPCVVLAVRNSFNELSVDVQPAINQKNRDGVATEYPPILNVPVQMPASRTSAVLIPLNVGDTVLCVFSMRGLDTFKRGTGRPSTPSDLRKFDARDAIAIPGVFPFGNSPMNPAKHVWAHDTNDTVIVHNLGTGSETEIRLKLAGGIQINTYQDVEVNCATASVTATEEINIASPSMNVNVGTTNWVGDIINTGTLSSNNVTLSGHKHNNGPTPDPGT